MSASIILLVEQCSCALHFAHCLASQRSCLTDKGYRTIDRAEHKRSKNSLHCAYSLAPSARLLQLLSRVHSLCLAELCSEPLLCSRAHIRVIISIFCIRMLHCAGCKAPLIALPVMLFLRLRPWVLNPHFFNHLSYHQDCQTMLLFPACTSVQSSLMAASLV